MLTRTGIGRRQAAALRRKRRRWAEAATAPMTVAAPMAVLGISMVRNISASYPKDARLGRGADLRAMHLLILSMRRKYGASWDRSPLTRTPMRQKQRVSLKR